MLLGILAGLQASLPVSASAEIKKIALICNGTICPVFLPELPLPKGWRLDQQMSDENKIQLLVPANSSYAEAPAIIYGKAFYNREKLTIDSRVETSNRHWRDSVKDARIERLADIARIKGGSIFQIHQYINPSESQQAAELVAFGEDTDKEGNLYGVQIVLSARDLAALTDSKPVFLELLRNY